MNKNSSLYHRLLDLVNQKEHSRAKVASYFSRSSEEEKNKAILQGIRSSDAKVRRQTYALIGELKDDSFLSEIIKGLKDQNVGVVQMAVWCIGQLRWREGLPHIIQVLERKYGFKVKKTIVWAMGEIGDPSALPYLLGLLKEGSTRLFEGILVAGIKLGEMAFLELLQSLDCENRSVQQAIQDISYASRQVRKAIIRTILHTRDPQIVGNLLQVLPYVSLHEEDYLGLIKADHEPIRLASYQSIDQSPLPWRIKQALFIAALEDPSNRVVRLSLLSLAKYMHQPKVQDTIKQIANQHPSPKLRDLSMRLFDQFQLVQTIREKAARWDRLLLETLPGIEPYLEQEAHVFGLSVEMINQGSGWIEMHLNQQETSLEDLKSMHTVSRIYGILSINKEGQEQFNPYVNSELKAIQARPMLDVHPLRWKELTINDTVYQCISLVEAPHMNRPVRNLQPTSLDWRVARAMVLASCPTTRDVFVDPTCGSGTILMDRAVFGPYRMLIGGDHDPESVKVARGNLKSLAKAKIYYWNAEELRLEDGSATVVVANLPFGRRVGNHEENLSFYPKFIREITRVLQKDGRAVLLTQEISLLKRTIQSLGNHVQIVSDQPIEMGGLRPHLICIRKK